jgi:hypothetical protein
MSYNMMRPPHSGRLLNRKQKVKKNPNFFLNPKKFKFLPKVLNVLTVIQPTVSAEAEEEE